MNHWLTFNRSSLYFLQSRLKGTLHHHSIFILPLQSVIVHANTVKRTGAVLNPEPELHTTLEPWHGLQMLLEVKWQCEREWFMRLWMIHASSMSALLELRRWTGVKDRAIWEQWTDCLFHIQTHTAITVTVLCRSSQHLITSLIILPLPSCPNNSFFLLDLCPALDWCGFWLDAVLHSCSYVLFW
jgi:hypothetical protein